MALRNVLMTLLHGKPATGYDLTKSFEEVAGFFWQASHQQVYRELSRMLEEGLVESKEIEQQGRPDKKIYSLTDVGLEQLRQWLRQPTEHKRNNDEGLVRLLGAELLGREGLIQDLQSQREAHKKRLAVYERIQAVDYADGFESKTNYQLMAYLTLLKGIRMEQARVKWTQEALSLLQQWTSV
jgi:PadR family transcriptional regulator AphA